MMENKQYKNTKVHESISSAFKYKQLKMKIKRTALTTLKLFTAWILMIDLGSLLFIYVEQCVREHPRRLSDLELAWMDMCNLVRNTTTTIVSSSENATTTQQDNTVIRNATTDAVLLKMCEQDNLQIVEDDRRCEFDMENFANYVDYCLSIAFTIGKLVK